jgi:hypothetical protein
MRVASDVRTVKHHSGTTPRGSPAQPVCSGEVQANAFPVQVLDGEVGVAFYRECHAGDSVAGAGDVRVRSRSR